MTATKTDTVMTEPEQTHRYVRWVPLIFFAGMFLYTGLIIRPALIYSAFGRFIDYPEFRMTGSFFMECVNRPGGLLDYSYGFLSQWFYYNWAGATILTVLALAIHACAASLLDSPGRQKLNVLPYVPAAAMIATCNGYHHSLAYFLAMFYALLAARLYQCAGSFPRTIRTLVFTILVCALYYLAGAACLWLIVLAVIQEVFYGLHWGAIVLYPLLSAAGVWLLGIHGFGLETIQAFLLHLPVSSVPLAGSRWLHSSTVMIAAYLAVPLSLILDWLGKRPVKESRQTRRHRNAERPRSISILRSSGFRVTAKMMALTILIGVTGWSYDTTRKHLLSVNHLARQQKWPELLALEMPASMPYNEYCEHDRIRALCETGRMADELFVHATTKTALLLTSNTEATLDPAAYAKQSELLLELGHVDMAEKKAYEQLQKMGPCPFILERLAMIHLVKGNMAIARVFLTRLSQDLIFGRQAKALLQTIDNDPELTGHQKVQQLRRNRADQDNINYHFAEGFFRELVEKNPSNRMAFEYMMAYHLLNGRIPLIAKNVHRLKDFGVTRVPRYYEEALVIYLNTTGPKMDLGPWKPGPQALARVAAFMTQFQNAGGLRNKAAAGQALQSRFGDTYTFYYTFAAPGDTP